MKISVNDVFEPVTELSLLSTMARAIHLDEKHDALIVMDLTDPPRKPYSIGLEEFRVSIGIRRYKACGDGSARISTGFGRRSRRAREA